MVVFLVHQKLKLCLLSSINYLGSTSSRRLTYVGGTDVELMAKLAKLVVPCVLGTRGHVFGSASFYMGWVCLEI